MQGDPSTIDNNLSRILYEVQNNIQWSYDSHGNPPPYNFAGFTQSTKTPYELAIEFLRYYERPAEYNQPIRGTQAEFWYEYLGGIIPPTPTNFIKTNFKWVLYANKIRKRNNILS